ncbi:hypothetical protein NMG60_11005724 [Bertholletia excelsa]
MELQEDDAQKRVSAIQGEGFYFDRLLLRESSFGNSSRKYYRSPEGVPFQWEMTPGTPLHPPENDAIPPLHPPPAVQSMALPRPPEKLSVGGSERGGSWRRAWFWTEARRFSSWRRIKHVRKGISRILTVTNLKLKMN